MSNALPDPQDDLFNLADDMLDGLESHETTAKIKQFTHATLQPLLTAARHTQRLYADAQLAETQATGRRNVASSNAKGYIAAGKNALLATLGSRPSQAWETLGYPPGTLAMPDSIPGRLAVLVGMGAYLLANPGKEFTTDDITFTAARAEILRAALAQGRDDLKTAVAHRADTRAPRDAAMKALRNAMSGLAEELGRLLAADSATWYYFGLVPPAGEERPGIPDSLTLVKGGPGLAIAACARSPRGQKYRFAIRLAPPGALAPAPGATDLLWIEQPLVSDPQLVLEDLPATGTLHARVQAHNAAGNSPWSPETSLALG